MLARAVALVLVLDLDRRWPRAARIAATISPFSTTFVTSTPSSWAICRSSRTGLFDVSMTSTGDGEGDTTRMSSSSESGPRFAPRFGVA